MAKQNNQTAKKLVATKVLADYLKKSEGEIVPKTIRATDGLWERLDRLADKHGESLNLICVLALEKACDEEGV